MTLVWILGFVILVVSIAIQFRALQRIAFSRSMFLTGMAFLVSFLVAFLVRSTLAWILFGLFQIIGWGFLFMMTFFSLRHLRRKKMHHPRA